LIESSSLRYRLPHGDVEPERRPCAPIQGRRGEHDLLDKQIREIEASYETLEDKKLRLARVADLLDSVKTIMSEIAPTWDASEERPTTKGQWKHPFKAGAVTHWTLDILREAKEPMRSRAIAERIMELNGRTHGDEREVTDRVRVTVDATLRSKLTKGLVESIDTWPVRWVIRDFGDRPQLLGGEREGIVDTGTLPPVSPEGS